MRAALGEARRAAREGEVPVGAEVVAGGRGVARGHNRSLGLNDPTAHAEIVALRRAARRLKNYRLAGATLYVTVEPCPMCLGAIRWARVSRLVYGARDPKAGACGGLVSLHATRGPWPRLTVSGGLLAAESAALLKTFFRARRLKRVRQLK